MRFFGSFADESVYFGLVEISVYFGYVVELNWYIDCKSLSSSLRGSQCAAGASVRS